MEQHHAVFVDPGDKKEHKTYMKSKIGSKISAMPRYSTAGHIIPELKAGTLIYQPTYQLVSSNPVNMDEMYHALSYTIRVAIASSAVEKYDRKRMQRFAQSMSRDVRQAVERLEYERFRIVSLVTIMERRDQSAVLKLGFMWDPEQDRWCHFYLEFNEFVVCAMVGAIYYE